MTVKPIPEVYYTVTPWVISRDTSQLIDYLKTAFDAIELARIVGEDGRIGHAEVRIGDSVVLMFDAKPDWPPTSVTDVTHLSFGDRVGRVRDPLGSLWWIQTRVEDVNPEEMQRRLGDPTFTAAMEYVTGAEFFPGRKPDR